MCCSRGSIEPESEGFIVAGLIAMKISSPSHKSTATEPWYVRWTLILLAVALMGMVILVPLAAVIYGALADGLRAYLEALKDPDTLSAVRLPLITAAIAVPLNVVFGVAAAWAIGKFRFVGRSLLISLIDVPLAVSPVISGLLYVLLFGLQGWWGPWLIGHNHKVIFAIPGIVLATIFVTFPMVAHEVIPLMESQGSEEEQAALVLGAGGWRTFWMVTMPNIKWGVIFGVILCNARAMGEFGAVSVVSGHIRGETNTVPLQVEILYNDYQYTAAFALATLLLLLALVTLILKTIVEWRAARAVG
jgi:sulfate transport system permease protein